MTAMTAATLDKLSGGRFILGIGTSGPQVSEGWHGVRFAKQLQRTREYVGSCGWPSRGSGCEFDGRDARAAAARRPGKALKLTIGPVQERMPIYIAAIGPKNTQLAGEIADGVHADPLLPRARGRHPRRARRTASTARGGKTLEDVEIAPDGAASTSPTTSRRPAT